MSILGKKLTAYYLDIDISHSIWKFQRYWIPKKRQLKKPVPMGIIFPILIFVLSKGIIKPFTFLQYDAKAKAAKAVKKRISKTWSEIMEWDLALISFWGIVSLLILILITDLLGFKTLSKYTLYYSLWNLIPISQLDGCKLFFSNFALFIFTLILEAIAILIIVF